MIFPYVFLPHPPDPFKKSYLIGNFILIPKEIPRMAEWCPDGEGQLPLRMETEGVRAVAWQSGNRKDRRFD